MAAPFKPNSGQPDETPVTPSATPAQETHAMNPAPPPGITTHPHASLGQIAIAAAALIADAREAGLTLPCSLNANEYGPPTASLYISQHDAPDIWRALQQWAARHHTEIATRPTSDGNSVHASAEFRIAGIRYDVYSVISPAPADDDPDDEDEDWYDDEDEGQ
jgi:hypothetical protein